ncbi:MAG: hypothetical protein PHP00_06310 [Thiotrichaceae bacterium]|nr:hypothetical protein [Thiotrichaceae bacterium]
MSSSLFVLANGSDAFLKEAKTLFDASRYEAVSPHVFLKSSTADHTKLVTGLKNLKAERKSSVKIYHSANAQLV